MSEIDGIPVGTTYDITIYQGRTFEQVFLVREADESTPVPLTGWSARSELRTRAGGALLLAFESIVDQPAGSITIRAYADATDALIRGGSYDIVLYKEDQATPLVLAFVSGKVTLKKEVTDFDGDNNA